jgi:hypothetical protein
MGFDKTPRECTERYGPLSCDEWRCDECPRWADEDDGSVAEHVQKLRVA